MIYTLDYSIIFKEIKKATSVLKKLYSSTVIEVKAGTTFEKREQ